MGRGYELNNNSAQHRSKAEKALAKAKAQEAEKDLVKVPCFRGYCYVERSKLKS